MDEAEIAKRASLSISWRFRRVEFPDGYYFCMRETDQTPDDSRPARMYMDGRGVVVKVQLRPNELDYACSDQSLPTTCRSGKVGAETTEDVYIQRAKATMLEERGQEKYELVSEMKGLFEAMVNFCARQLKRDDAAREAAENENNPTFRSLGILNNPDAFSTVAREESAGSGFTTMNTNEQPVDQSSGNGSPNKGSIAVLSSAALAPQHKRARVESTDAGTHGHGSTSVHGQSAHGLNLDSKRMIVFTFGVVKYLIHQKLAMVQDENYQRDQHFVELMRPTTGEVDRDFWTCLAKLESRIDALFRSSRQVGQWSLNSTLEQQSIERALQRMKNSLVQKLEKMPTQSSVDASA